jgi:hypothetical protein
MPMSPAVIISFAIAVAAFMLSLGFFLGTCWAAINSDLTPRGVDTGRAGRPLRAGDLHIDRFDYVPDGRRLMAVNPVASADCWYRSTERSLRLFQSVRLAAVWLRHHRSRL